MKRLIIAVFVILFLSHWASAENAADEKACLIKASAFKDKGDLLSAIEETTKAIEANPQSDKAYELRGKLFVQNKQYPEAIMDFTKLIELKNGAFAYSLRADAKRKSGDIKGADEDLAQGKTLRQAVPGQRTAVSAPGGLKTPSSNRVEKILSSPPQGTEAEIMEDFAKILSSANPQQTSAQMEKELKQSAQDFVKNNPDKVKKMETEARQKCIVQKDVRKCSEAQSTFTVLEIPSLVEQFRKAKCQHLPDQSLAWMEYYDCENIKSVLEKQCQADAPLTETGACLALKDYVKQKQNGK